MDAKCVKFYEFGSPKDVLRVEDKSIEPPKELNHQKISRGKCF